MDVSLGLWNSQIWGRVGASTLSLPSCLSHFHSILKHFWAINSQGFRYWWSLEASDVSRLWVTDLTLPSHLFKYHSFPTSLPSTCIIHPFLNSKTFPSKKTQQVCQNPKSIPSHTHLHLKTGPYTKIRHNNPPFCFDFVPLIQLGCWTRSFNSIWRSCARRSTWLEFTFLKVGSAPQAKSNLKYQKWSVFTETSQISFSCLSYIQNNSKSSFKAPRMSWWAKKPRAAPHFWCQPNCFALGSVGICTLFWLMFLSAAIEPWKHRIPSDLRS